MDEKVFKRCVNRVFIYFNASYSTIINGECEIASTTYYLNSDSRNSRISSCILIQGATEEIIVRGWLFPVLSVRSRIWVGIIVTSFLFGFLHLLNPGITILSISNIILVGVFAALYVLKEDGLWGICAWHSIWNWAQYNVYGFAVSGTTVYSTPIFKSITNGPETLHGGTFGIEGSIITTIMLTVASIVLWRKLWGRKAKQRNFS